MKKINLLGIAVFGAVALHAQDIGQGHLPVTLTLIGGTQLTDSFSANNTGSFVSSQQFPGSSYSTHTPRWEVGVGGEFRLPWHNLRFEVDGLAKRLAYTDTTGTGSSLAYHPTTAVQWEIPGMFKFNFLLGHYRPFALVGASYRHISSITRYSNPYGSGPVATNNAPELVNRNSFGGVAGLGITFKKGPFELSPQVRYTRWANQSFNAYGFRTNLDQGDALLAIGF
jgi:hypothetical protein